MVMLSELRSSIRKRARVRDDLPLGLLGLLDRVQGGTYLPVRPQIPRRWPVGIVMERFLRTGVEVGLSELFVSPEIAEDIVPVRSVDI